MSTLLLTFANSSTNPLSTLADEYRGVTDALRDRTARRDFSAIYAPIANRDDIIKDIRANQENLTLFLFSGHAGRDRIMLMDGTTSSDALADSLGSCPNLKLVILNGCSTAGQVKALLNKRIPIVIATSSPVEDKKASRFSIVFFREMAINKTINQAFEVAVEESNWYGSYQKIEKVERGLLLSRQNEDDEKPMWGLYYGQPEGEILMTTFRLPTVDTNIDRYGVNNEITDSLLGISERYGVDPSKERILALLPFLISEPIRKLLTPREGIGLFYDSPSKDRFKMLLFAYRAIINLATYTLLANIWDDALSQERKSAVTAESAKLFTSTYFRESGNVNSHSNLELLKLLLNVVKQEGISCFIDEMDSLPDVLSAENTRNALDDLEFKLTKEDQLSGSPDLLNLCLETESNLGRVLFDFGFMIKYGLTSIPNIELLKNQRLRSQVYRHRFLTLRNQSDALRKEDEHLVSDFPLDNYSVIIHKHQDRSTNLNLSLSPFLVDKNALDNSSKPDLHFLEYFSPKDNTFYYCPATSYKNIWVVGPEEIKGFSKSKYSPPIQATGRSNSHAAISFNSLLLRQIDSFASTVLKKSLKYHD